MAWLDDRAWCHPKLVDLSDRAFRVYVNSISYSSGMGLRGRISGGQQRLLGADTKVTKQIVDAGLWHYVDDGAVEINDWDEHNGKRDERRRADRERKRQARAQERMSAGLSTGRSTGPARVEGSEGSEGSEGQKQIDPIDRLIEVCTDRDSGTRATLAALALRYRLNEGDFEFARECATGSGVISPTAVAVSTLIKRGQEKAA